MPTATATRSPRTGLARRVEEPKRTASDPALKKAAQRVAAEAAKPKPAEPPKPKAAPRAFQVATAIDEDLHTRLRARAKAEGGISAVLRTALERHLA